MGDQLVHQLRLLGQLRLHLLDRVFLGFDRIRRPVDVKLEPHVQLRLDGLAVGQVEVRVVSELLLRPLRVVEVFPILTGVCRREAGRDPDGGPGHHVQLVNLVDDGCTTYTLELPAPMIRTRLFSSSTESSQRAVCSNGP